MLGRSASSRSYWLLTEAVVPVDHEFAGQSVVGEQLPALYAAVVKESPSASIEVGTGAGGPDGAGLDTDRPNAASALLP
jgi:hypothetical protein